MKKIACIIIENRKLFYLNNVLNNFLHYLEPDKAKGFIIDIFLYTDEFNVNSYLTDDVVSNINIIYNRLPNFYLQSVHAHTTYSWFLTQATFWKEYLAYDRVLIFQHDALLTKGNIFSDNWDFIETQDFLGSEVGPNSLELILESPDVKRIFNIDQYNLIKKEVQIHNGGLSIRNPKKMYEICNDPKNTFFSLNYFAGEDLYFSQHCQDSMVSNDILFEYRTPYDKGFSFLEKDPYGLHFSIDAMRDDDCPFFNDIPYLTEIKFAQHIWSEEFYKVNRPKLNFLGLLTKIQDQFQLAKLYNLC